MESVSDGGGGVSVSTPATVPLLVRPEALAATANRLEALADQLQQCLNINTGRLTPLPPGNDAVSRAATSQFALQQFTATQQIDDAIAQLHDAADSCRVSAMQYQQTDDSLGYTAHRA